jgi:hypothetical protein
MYNYNTLGIQFGVAVDGTRQRIVETEWVDINKWSHLVGTYDGVTLKVYINGSCVDSKDADPSGPIDSTLSTLPLYIGGIPGTNNYFYGKIDEVAIYNRALTLEEIQQHYQNGLNGLGYELSEVFQLNCVGFESPMDKGAVTVKKNRVLPLKAVLLDSDSNPITDADITALPVLQVIYDSGTGVEPVDVTDDALPAGQGTDGNEFVFTNEGKWQFNLKTKNYSSSGTYSIFIVSGDDLEYVINPSCEAQFVIK